MKDYKIIISTLLYGLFGLLLSLAGVGVTTQPGMFFALLGVVMFIDIFGHISGSNG